MKVSPKVGDELEALIRRLVREELARQRDETDTAATDDDSDLRELAASDAARIRRRRDAR